MSVLDITLDSGLSSSYGLKSIRVEASSIFEDGYEVDMTLTLDGFKRMESDLRCYKDLYYLITTIEKDPALAEQFNEIKTIIKLKHDQLPKENTSR